MQQSLDELITELDSLLADLDTAEMNNATAIASVAEVHRRGAVNLVHYAALRQHDRRELQHDLTNLGVTSLATTEADVRSKVRAARNVLQALRRDVGPWVIHAIREALDEGDAMLRANSEAIFGPMRAGRPTRIMVTLPWESADAPGLVAAFVEAGMDVARINCAHDQLAVWASNFSQHGIVTAGRGPPVRDRSR